MLILTRRVGKTVVINDDIKIIVLGIVNGSVRLGFEAPKNVTIHREEIWDKIQEGKKANPSKITQDIVNDPIAAITPDEIKL